MCTTMIITKGATADGSMMVTHSDDNELSDQRIVRVPAQDHASGEMRQVFSDNCRYPRFVTDQRGDGYNTSDEMTVPIGEIPQVEHTYAYYDGNYGIMNEYNLMMGECTCAANYQPDYVTTEEAAKKNIHCRFLYSAELSRIALERCTKAIDAVKLMGSLIEEYGLFSTGETLLVGDENEAWVFEMCALNDEEYHSAWVAQKVTDGEIFVAANEFRIRTIVKNDDNHYVDEDNNIEIWYSKLLFPGLVKMSIISEDEDTIDWLKAISPGEYAHPYYSLRRVWRVFDRANPDLALSPWVDDGYATDYPFSIPPKEKLTLADIFSLYRDHYEGTEFDLTQGVAAGPYGDPHRFIGPYDPLQNNMSGTNRKYYGAWERSISIFYQGYTYVNQIRPNAPDANKGTIWFGADVVYTTCFVPIPVKTSGIPQSYEQINPQQYEPDKAWWLFNVTGAYARLNWKMMTANDIIPLQRQLETEQYQKLESWDDPSTDLTTQCAENCEYILAKWKQLQFILFRKYADGYINLPTDKQYRNIGYPARWLAYTNYSKGPTTYDMVTEY